MIIIGGGIAGLCAGIYAQRCGFRSTIFEAHTRPGGVCTSWRRGPYLLDAGVRMIIGTAPPNPFYELLREVGVIPGVRFSRIDVLHSIEHENGGRLRFHRSIDELSDNLVRTAPEDRDRILKFIDILADFSGFSPNLDIEPQVFSMKEGLKSLLAIGPVAPHFIRYWKVPLSKWLEQFRSSFFRESFLKMYPVKDFAVLSMFSSLGWLVGGQVSRPRQGSLDVVDALSSKYSELGGELVCGRKVKRILTESDRAVGVGMEDGSEKRADIVISASDGHSTIFDMLDGRHTNGEMKGYYDELPVFDPLIIIHYGLASNLGQEPESIYFPLKRDLTVMGRKVKSINMHHQSGAPFAPPGHSVLRIGIETAYEPWKELARSPEKYRREKERIADDVLDRLEERYPGTAGSVKVRDVATPITFERYTGNWKGAYEGWKPTTRTFGLRMKKTLRGLKDFYMTGQWVEPGGGVPGVLFNARNTIRLVCAHRKKKFTPAG